MFGSPRGEFAGRIERPGPNETATGISEPGKFMDSLL